MEKFFRAIGILICLALMVGFGACGIMGIVAGISENGIGGIGIGLGLVGVAVSVGCFFAVRNILKAGSAADKPPTP